MAGIKGIKGKYHVEGLKKLDERLRMKELLFLIMSRSTGSGNLNTTIKDVKSYYGFLRKREATQYSSMKFHHAKQQLSKITISGLPIIEVTDGHKGKSVRLSCNDDLIVNFILHYLRADIEELFNQLREAIASISNVSTPLEDEQRSSTTFMVVAEKLRKQTIKAHEKLRCAEAKLPTIPDMFFDDVKVSEKEIKHKQKLKGKAEERLNVPSLRKNYKKLNAEYFALQQAYHFNRIFRQELEYRLKQAEHLKVQVKSLQLTAPLLKHEFAHMFRRYLAGLLYANQLQKPVAEIVRHYVLNIGDKGYPMRFGFSSSEETQTLKELFNSYKELHDFQPEDLFLKMPLQVIQDRNDYEEHERQQYEWELQMSKTSPKKQPKSNKARAGL